MSSDAIVILKADHKEIRNLFRKFQAAGVKAVKTKETIVGQTEMGIVTAANQKRIVLAEGEVALNGTVLQDGDAAEISEESALELSAKKPAQVLLFDLN